MFIGSLIKPCYCLVNTRPVNQAKALNELIKQAGGKILSCPTIQIEMLEPLNFNWNRFNDFDKVVFISQNAVEGFVIQLKKNLSLIGPKPEKPKIYAIGLATEISLNRAGFKVETLASRRFDSENLIKIPSFKNIKNQKILIVKGKGGRDYLENTLSEKGAKIFFCEVYKRKTASFCCESWLKIKQASLPVFLWTSVESFMAFKQQCPQYFNVVDFNWACQQLCVVFSERIKSVLFSQGWQGRIIVVSIQSNLGIVAAIQKINQGASE